MKRFLITFVLALIVFNTFGQTELVKVRGKGVGADRMEALKDAYRDAVEQAVGLYVDAEQMVKNEDLVKDQILTQSNAYIEKYKIAKESTAENGLITITILADVRKRDLTRKIRDVMPSNTIDLSGISKDLHAQIITDFKANDDALTIIRNELQNLQPLKQLMKVTLGAVKPVVESVKEDSSMVRLWYPIKVEVDASKYYKEFVPRWSRILDQVKVAPARRLDMKNNLTYVKAYNDAVVKKFGTERKNRIGIMTRCEKPNSKGWPYSGILEEWGLALNEEYQGMAFLETRILGKEYVLRGLHQTFAGRVPYAAGLALDAMPSRVHSRPVERVFTAGYNNCGLSKQIDGGCNFVVGLVTTTNRTALSGTIYKIPQNCVDEIAKWQHRIVCDPNADYKYRETAPEVGYELKFVDEGRNEVVAQSFSLRNLEVMNIGCVLLENTEYRDSDHIGGIRLWLITPLVGGFAQSYVKWISVDIPKDDVAKIATASISVEE